MRGASLERPPSLSRFHRDTHNRYGRNNRPARMLRRGAFRYRLSLLKCILHSMSRYRSYRAPMLIGLIAGAVITYILMNYVWSMKPWEQAVRILIFGSICCFAPPVRTENGSPRSCATRRLTTDGVALDAWSA